MKRVSLPLGSDLANLSAGEEVLLSGTLYTARDAACQRLVSLLRDGQDLPVNIKGETIYFVGPCPAPPGKVIGSAGPTTSYRMDPFTPELLAAGLKGMIGKGPRGGDVRSAIAKYGAVYFAAIGGIGALLAKTVCDAQIVAFEDLGPEAIRRLTVRDMPVIVAIDPRGSDLYESGRVEYLRRKAND